MKPGPEIRGIPRSAELGDVYRLWQTLGHDLKKGLEIHIEPLIGEDHRGCLAVQVISREPPVGDLPPVVHVWSQKMFYATGYSISWGHLFDLLIHAYYAIEEDLLRQGPQSARPTDA